MSLRLRVVVNVDHFEDDPNRRVRFGGVADLSCDNLPADPRRDPIRYTGELDGWTIVLDFEPMDTSKVRNIEERNDATYNWFVSQPGSTIDFVDLTVGGVEPPDVSSPVWDAWMEWGGWLFQRDDLPGTGDWEVFYWSRLSRSPQTNVGQVTNSSLSGIWCADSERDRWAPLPAA